MTFEKSAYLFDSSLIGGTGSSQIASVVSFVSNQPYIKAYSSDVIGNFNMTSYTGRNFIQWLSIENNKDAFISFITQLYNEKENLGLASFIVESNYLKFIYLLCLKSNCIETTLPNIRNQIDSLYADYLVSFSPPLISEDIIESVRVFNERITNLINGKKEYVSIKNLFKDYGRSLEDQLSIVRMSILKTGIRFTLHNYSLYIKQLIDFYSENNIKDIYTTSETGNCFSHAINKINCSGNISFNIINGQEDGFENVSTLSSILLMFSDYIFSKLVHTHSIDELTDEDRYFFVIAWFVFQNDYGNMLFNSSVYSLMQEIFDSMREELTIE